MNNDEPCETPVRDLLASIPLDCHVWHENAPNNTSHFPVGRLAARAVAEIDRLKAELAAAREDRPTAKEYEDVCTTNHSMEQEIAELRALCAARPRPMRNSADGRFTDSALAWFDQIDAAGRGEGAK